MIGIRSLSLLFLQAAFLVAILVFPACRTPSTATTDPDPSGKANAPASATSPDAPRAVQPGAPGESSRVLSREELALDAQPSYTEADVQFMQGMIAHHAQALDMTTLVPSRTNRKGLRLLARRIEVSQLSEIRLMQNWLKDRGEQVPEIQAHHGETHEMHMPGMLTEEEMIQLSEATGTEFEALFLKYMIRHHEGALVMVADLFASPGATQDTDIFRFATDVDVDQRMEIERMRAMLNAGH